MKFWCNQCETAFDGEPDAPDLPQSRCAICDTVCLSFDMELEDAKRFHENNVVGVGLVSGLLSGLFGLVGWGISAPTESSSIPAIISYATKNKLDFDDFVIGTYEEAFKVQRFLGEHGVICKIENNNGSHSLVVDQRDVQRARRLIRENN